jgi:hypothetical protein
MPRKVIARFSCLEQLEGVSKPISLFVDDELESLVTIFCSDAKTTRRDFVTRALWDALKNYAPLVPSTGMFHTIMQHRVWPAMPQVKHVLNDPLLFKKTKKQELDEWREKRRLEQIQNHPTERPKPSPLMTPEEEEEERAMLEQAAEQAAPDREFMQERNRRLMQAVKGIGVGQPTEESVSATPQHPQDDLGYDDEEDAGDDDDVSDDIEIEKEQPKQTLPSIPLNIFGDDDDS